MKYIFDEIRGDSAGEQLCELLNSGSCGRTYLDYLKGKTGALSFKVKQTVYNGGSRYEFETADERYKFLIYKASEQGYTLRVCLNCKKYFIAKRHDSYYCHNAAPQKETVSCVRYVKDVKTVEARRNTVSKKCYHQIHNLLVKRIKRASDNAQAEIYKKALDDFLMESGVYREKLKDGRISERVYADWLKAEHIRLTGKGIDRREV